MYLTLTKQYFLTSLHSPSSMYNSMRQQNIKSNKYIHAAYIAGFRLNRVVFNLISCNTFLLCIRSVLEYFFLII